ncbi:MAG: glycosyltransferase family 9 protein [Phototrophicaceae bacterium]
MRILIIRPCCIGDVVMTTAALAAVRAAYPDAHITMAVGGWSQHAISYHPALDAIVDTGSSAMPVKSLGGFWHFVHQMRSGKYDIVISLVRSPLMSLAVLLSGSPIRAGINSNGRGFGYNHRYAVMPDNPQHEADIYLQVVAQLGIEIVGFRANLPIVPDAQVSLQRKLTDAHISKPYIVINPAGGSNPGMILDSKRWLPQNFAVVANTLADEHQAQVILIGSAADQPIIDAVQARLDNPATEFAGTLSFPEIGALAHDALLYLGNDTGLTHLAAASGAKTAMIMGISDPRRYAPFTDDSLVLWKPTNINHGGVAAADNSAWDWARDGIPVDEALEQLRAFLA